MLGLIKRTILARKQGLIKRRHPGVNVVLHPDMPSPSISKVSAMVKAVAVINGLEPEMRPLSDSQLRGKTAQLREHVIKKNREYEGQVQALEEALSLSAIQEEKDKIKEKLKNTRNRIFEDILSAAFAVVREASRRTLGMRHFDVQLIGGMLLHEGRIAEMATGEGKTLVATLAAYLNALLGRGVHIVTVNDYLARRDREWMGPIYEFLGLSVGTIQHDLGDEERKAAYGCDITYGTNNEFGFDYLRDNMKYSLSELVQRPFYYAIVDEVDSILIDEARTPLIISGPAEESTDKYYTIDRIIPRLKGRVILEREEIEAKYKGEDLSQGYDYIVDEKAHTAHLTEQGESKVCSVLGVDNLHEIETMDWRHHVIQGLRAHNLYKRDVDYVVKDGQVIIVDEFTGRMMPGRRWSDGLHQAVEAKEGMKIERENQTLATITFQNYFRMYEKLAGMTGTAYTEAAEFKAIYGLDTVVLPTNTPLIRTNHPDCIYKTQKEKFNAVVEEIGELYNMGRPVLVGTISIDRSERLSDMLKLRGISHQVLNAKYHEMEAQIVAQAGRFKGVTIATNMAGRGTDILLGGNPEYMARSLARENVAPEEPGHQEEYKRCLEKYRKETDEEHRKVVELGGLHVLGTERHEARRIDNQLRGRSGRQGDPGSSRFYVSLEDELMRLFGSDRVMGIMTRLGFEEGQVIEHPWVSKSIEIAQRRVEQYNFEIRKQLLEYDNVMNKQREIVYGQRRSILEGVSLKEEILAEVSRNLDELTGRFCAQNLNAGEWDIEGLKENFRLKFGIKSDLRFDSLDKEGIKQALYDSLANSYREKERSITEEMMRHLERMVFLQIIDAKWKDHLYTMDTLREGIGLRAYGQRDPLIEYKHEGFEMFQSMINGIRDEAMEAIFKIQPVKREPETFRGVFSGTSQEFLHPQATKFQKTAEDEGEAPNPYAAEPRAAAAPASQSHPKVGRNDPCTCGSGKKYKKCCGK